MWAVKRMKDKYGGTGRARADRNGRDGDELAVEVGERGDEGPMVRNLIWIPDEEKVWRAVRQIQTQECLSPRGQKSTVKNKIVRVILSGQPEPVEVSQRDTHTYDPSHALDLDDASKMNQMHEAPLLGLLLRRFRQDIIYTNVADVLISVNPYKSIPLLYEVPLQQMQDDSDDEYEESEGEQQDSGVTDSMRPDTIPTALRNKLSKPHVFSVADRAFRFMTGVGGEFTNEESVRVDQSIIITGESGSGKTEASKHVMRYLITASQLLTGEIEEAERDVAGVGTAKRIEEVLLKSSTVLEAFGNAKTVRNDNSSRFGKYIKLLYDGAFRLVGARTEHFLLEKSRLVKVDHGERGYHIFYQLLAGLGPEEAERLHLGSARRFRGISQGDCVTVSDEVDDGQEFRDTDKAMNTLGFEKEDKGAIFRVLAALLHLSNVVIEENEDLGQAQAKVTLRMMRPEDYSANMESLPEDVAHVISLREVAGLLGLDEDSLVRKIAWRGMIAPNQSCHEIPLTALEARDNLSALAKHTYGKLFAWIVGFINRCHNQHIVSTNDEVEEREGRKNQCPRGFVNGGDGDVITEEGVKVKSFIGILDIFGFEIMTENSFEQLCINFANEVLQRQFNHHIFVLEQAEYKAQGLDIAAIPFRNNQAVIDLISQKPTGLMVILEDQVLTGRKAHATNKLTDRSVLDLYHQEHHRRKPHPNYEKPRIECDHFILQHFAGRVTYDITGFLEKNNDSLQDDLRALLLDSEDPFVFTLESNRTEAVIMSSPGGNDSLPSPPPGNTARRESRRGSEARGEVRLANKATVSSVFRRQLDRLVYQLGETEPHYIKCIKPNAGKAPGGWSSPLVIEQLRYSGVLEVVRIRREAYPIRVDFSELFQKFRYLLPWRRGGNPQKASPTSPEGELKELCLEICRAALDFGEFQMGTSKVFLKGDALDKLRWALQEKYVTAACGIQRKWRARTKHVRNVRAAEALTAIKARWRGSVAAKKYGRLLSARRDAKLAAATAMQRLARGKAARVACAHVKEDRRVKREGQVQLARIARGYVSRKRLERSKSAATAVQAGVRAYNARKAFVGLKTNQRLKREREARRATKLQAWARMLIARRARGRARAASTTIASAWRTRVAVENMRRDMHRITVAQTLARGYIARRRFARDLRQSSRIQAFIRGFLRRRWFKRARRAAQRLKRCIRAWLRNLLLYHRVTSVFAAAREGDVRKVTRIVTDWPEILYVRDRYGERCAVSAGLDPLPCYDTLVHAACQSGVMDLVVLLEPFPEDVTECDRDGNSCMHIAALAADYELVKYLARRYNMDVGRALSQDAERLQAVQKLSRRQVNTSVNVFKTARLERATWISQRAAAGTSRAKARDTSPSGRTIMSGYLRKRRETDRWLRRWCVLTESSLLYFHRQTDSHPSKIIALSNAMLKKSGHIDFAFEIHTPDLLDKKNREGRLYFQSSGEKELQQWMVPLRAVVAHYQFRNDKRREHLVYLNEDWRSILVRLTNKKGETPLHMTMRAQGRGEVFGETNNIFGDTGKRTTLNDTIASINFADNGDGEDHVRKDEVDNRNPAVGAERNSKAVEQRETMRGTLTLGATISNKSCVLAVQRLAAWLVENGADPNAVDSAGFTPLHVAVVSGNSAAAATLARKGGDLTIERSCDGLTAVELAINHGEMSKIVDEDQERQRRLLELLRAASHPLLPPPVKLFGFTHASFYLEKTTFPPTGIMGALDLTPTVGGRTAGGGGGGMQSTTIGNGGADGTVIREENEVEHGRGGRAGIGLVGGQQPRDDLLFLVTVTVYSGKGMLTEAQQDIVLPIMTGPDYLWWAHTWHMQTPLETLGPGSFVTFELKEQHTGAKNERKTKGLCWGVYHLDPDEVNTRPESLSTYSGRPDPTLTHLEPSEFTFLGEAFFTKGTGSAKFKPTQEPK